MRVLANLMRHIFRHSLLGLLVFSTALSAEAMGPMTDASQKPLVIIRFNQPRIYFDKQLFTAISKAVAIKPEVSFNVVSYAPVTGDPQADSKWQALASRDTQSVLASMQNMGIPINRIQVSGQQDAGLKYDETHIFVR